MFFVDMWLKPLALVFNLSVTVRDALAWLYSLSIIPQVSWFHRVKNRNTAASLAKSISLLFPDVTEELHTLLFCACVGVCAFFVFHLAEVIPPQCFFIMCHPRLKLRHTAILRVQRKHTA